MQAYLFEGKTKEDIVEDAFNTLNKKEDSLIIKFHEEKGGIFKAKKVEATVYVVDEIVDFVKNKLIEIVKIMGLDIKLEVKNRDKVINLKMYSDNNNILIGRNGKTLESLQIILKQIINTKCGVFLNIQLDVENYKDSRNHRIERLAKNVAKEVIQTQIEAKLDNMNSYERRIVHETLKDWKDIYTESIGEEPNRHVIIKPKDSK